MQSAFVQNSSGSWDLYVNNEPFGVTFEIPDDYTMMAYKFFLSNDEINSVKACKDVVFVLDEPHKMRSIVIDAEANTRFLLLAVIAQKKILRCQNSMILLLKITKIP